MPSILFVCTANQFRSPLAAACLLKVMEQERAAEPWTIESAGTWTTSGMPAARLAVQAARQLGVYGLHGHRTRQIDEELLQKYDLVVVMEQGHKEAIASEFPSTRGRLYLLSEIAEGVPCDIPDPAQPGTNPVDVVRDIYGMVSRGKEKIMEMARSLSAMRAP